MSQVYKPFTVRADGLDGKKADQFEASVLGMLRALNALATGRVLMDAFRTVGREVLVFPYDGSQGTCNAWADSDWGMFRNKISFTPNGWFATSSCFTNGSAGVSALEVLMHEMVHALRFAAKTLGKNVSDEQEEDLAILVTNLLSSETNRPLRKDHHGFAVLPSSDPVKYYAANLRLIDTFCRQHPDFTNALARLKIGFNPLREYYDRER